MTTELGTPRTRFEWGIFVGLLLALYAVLLFLTTDDVLSSLAMAVVAAWRIVTG